jgi:hypothetical protein
MSGPLPSSVQAPVTAAQQAPGAVDVTLRGSPAAGTVRTLLAAATAARHRAPPLKLEGLRLVCGAIPARKGTLLARLQSAAGCSLRGRSWAAIVATLAKIEASPRGKTGSDLDAWLRAYARRAVRQGFLRVVDHGADL